MNHEKDDRHPLGDEVMPGGELSETNDFDPRLSVGASINENLMAPSITRPEADPEDTILDASPYGSFPVESDDAGDKARSGMSALGIKGAGEGLAGQGILPSRGKPRFLHDGRGRTVLSTWQKAQAELQDKPLLYTAAALGLGFALGRVWFMRQASGES